MTLDSGHTRPDSPSIQIIGLSLHDSEDMELTIRGAGASAYLPKSGPLDELKRTIKDCVQSRDDQ